MIDSHQTSERDVMMEEKRLTWNFERGTPGGAAIFSTNKTPEQKEFAKRRSKFYSDVFAHREPNSSARDRIHRESIVMADVRTNVTVNDEYTFTTDLSYNLSNRYQRSESSILVTVTHSGCLLLGGSFEPAYTLTITALPSQVQPVTNKRNAMILQKILEESLGVPPSRGLIKFVGIAEENYAFNGKTAAAEIDELEKEQADGNTNLRRRLSSSALKAATKRQSMRSIRNLKAGIMGGNINVNTREPLSPGSERFGHLTPPLSERDTPIPVPAIPVTPAVPRFPRESNAMDKKAEKVRRMGKRKSFIAGFFSK